MVLYKLFDKQQTYMSMYTHNIQVYTHYMHVCIHTYISIDTETYTQKYMHMPTQEHLKCTHAQRYIYISQHYMSMYKPT